VEGPLLTASLQLCTDFSFIAMPLLVHHRRATALFAGSQSRFIAARGDPNSGSVAAGGKKQLVHLPAQCGHTNC